MSRVLIESADVTIFDPEAPPDSPPIYDGMASSAHERLVPGIYPGTGEEGQEVLVVVLANESFAVTTDLPYKRIAPIQLADLSAR